MAIGTRITERLAELGWQRNDLLDRVENLSAQALSNLIVRDSRRSEWDEQIAEALGVSVLWLVYGKQQEYSTGQNVTRLLAAEPPPLSGTLKKIADTAAQLSPEGQLVALGRLEELTTRFPAAAKNTAH